MTTRDNHLAFIRQSSRPIEPIPTGESALLKPLHNIEAVLLDVYGTLFVSSSGEIGACDADASAVAFRQALAGAGLALLIDPAEGAKCLRATIEDSHDRSRKAGLEFPEVDIVDVWRMTLGSMQQRGQIKGDMGQADIPSLSLRYELLTNPVWPMPGAVEVLTELVSRGIHLGLISNAQWFTPLLFPALLGAELDALGIASGMQFWSWRVGHAKPGQYLFRQAAESLRHREIQPEHVLHVGNDMLNDVTPAAAAGFRTALFAGDRTSLRRREGDPRVASVRPDLVLVHLRDILCCVRNCQE